MEVCNGYYLNDACILKPKTDDIEIPKNAETSQASILNILEILAQIPFAGNDQGDDDKKGYNS